MYFLYFFCTFSTLLCILGWVCRLLAEQAEKSASDFQLRLKQRDAELRTSQDRCQRLDDRVVHLQMASETQLQEISRFQPIILQLELKM